MNTDQNVQAGMGGIDPIPTSPEPLSPGRTDVNPDREPGIDELPDNEGEIPLDTDDEAPLQEDVPDQDVDSAEMDDAPNPR